MNESDRAAYEKFDRSYAANIRYFGEDRDHMSILKEKAGILERWPQRRYQLRLATLWAQCQNSTTCIAGSTVDYIVQRYQQGQTNHGTWMSRFVIDVSHAQFKIIAEDGQNVMP
jgi:hypothetical protein